MYIYNGDALMCEDSGRCQHIYIGVYIYMHRCIEVYMRMYAHVSVNT